MKTPWTPGPWKIRNLYGDESSRVAIDAPTHADLARVVWLMSDDEYLGTSSPEKEANARLIANAPNLAKAIGSIIELSSRPNISDREKMDRIYDTALNAAQALDSDNPRPAIWPSWVEVPKNPPAAKPTPEPNHPQIALDEARQALSLAVHQFRNYAEKHTAKGSIIDDINAKENLAIAGVCEAALEYRPWLPIADVPRDGTTVELCWMEDGVPGGGCGAMHWDDKTTSGIFPWMLGFWVADNRSCTWHEQGGFGPTHYRLPADGGGS